MKRKAVQLESLIPILKERFKEDKDAIIQIKGTSMRPFYRDNQTLVKLTQPGELKKRDAVLFVSERGHYVLHRIEKIKGDTLIISGDGNRLKDTVPTSNVIARVKAHSHDNIHWTDERNPQFRRKVMLWQRLKPLRGILMRFKRFNHKDG